MPHKLPGDKTSKDIIQYEQTLANEVKPHLYYKGLFCLSVGAKPQRIAKITHISVRIQSLVIYLLLDDRKMSSPSVY
jgi:hypothetical protein